MDQAMPAVTSLFGRESETRVLAELFDHLHDHGGSVVVSGEPGVGKSALLREASALAQDRGMLVLMCTGVQCEAQLPFAGLHQLLRPVLGRLDGLAAPQRGAMLAAFGLTDDVAPDLFLTALAALDLLAESAARAPVLVVAEDAQWLDRATCDVLAFVARRLEFEPILLVAAIRDGFESPFNDAGLPALHLEPLAAEAAAALLDSRAPGLPAAVRERVLAETAGNPLALVELPIAFRHLSTGAGLPAWLPLTTRLEQAFAARVSDLPVATRTALLVAALNDKPRINEVIQATALLEGPGLTADVLAPAVAARLVEIDDSEYLFRHPLMRTAIHQEASISQRHAALALQAWSAAQLADLGAAIPAAEEGRRLAQETNQPLVLATAQAVQALLVALRGDQDAAEDLAAQAEQVSVPIGVSAVLAAVQFARGLAALGGGRPAEALQHLRRLHDPADPAYHAAVRCCTVADLADAARRSGDPDGIGAIADEMEAAARQTPSPLLHAGLRYARALLAEDHCAGALFETALQSDMSTWPFLRARVQLAYGEWLHQQRHDSASRAPLRAARETFDALGISPWSERARQQLRATGETSRPRTPEARDQLTPQELQIAQMAADGLSNREIGQMIYLSHRTVSSHLYRAFPKLGITSRTQLRSALERGTRGHT